MVCRKVPSAEVVLYFDFGVKKLAKCAIFGPILTHYFSDLFLCNENDGYPIFLCRYYPGFYSLLSDKNVQMVNS
jgi:hypothetical protein